MRKLFILTILFIGFSVQQCTIGCQVCSANNVCSICDIVNNYYLSGTKCVLSVTTNCRVRAQNGDCALCNNGYYVDANTKQCLAVATASLVTGCLAYNSAQACTLCQSGQYIAAATCKASDTLIADCDYYSDNGVCSQCKSGFIFAANLVNCIAIPANSNCFYYTFVSCEKCAAGFTYNPNNYFNVWNTAIVQNAIFVNTIIKENKWRRISVCQANSALNCLTQNKFNECITCPTGYYFDNKLCIAFPLPPIYGCSVYLTATTCGECKKGMFLKGPTECLNNILIDKCLLYSATAPVTTCIQCVPTHFLNANACSLRVVSAAIFNCKDTSIASDKCEVCQAGFVLTDDKLACLAEVTNCATNAPATINTSNIQCSSCKAGYYLTIAGNPVVCVLGTVVNCATYLTGGETVNQNKCLTCKNGFYLANNLCVAHSAIDNCDVFHQSIPNTCYSCKIGFYSFSITSICVATTAITGCETYSADGNSCLACAKTYYPVGNTCVLIPSGFSNCLVFDGFACTRCDTNYMVNELLPAGTCVKLPDYIMQTSTAASTGFCNAIRTEKNQIPTWNQFPVKSDFNAATAQNFFPLSCENCVENYYPYRPSAIESVCVNVNELGLYAGFGTRDTNCRRYGLSFSNKEIVCLECVSGYFISNYHIKAHWGTAKTVSNPNGITCVQGCALTKSTSDTVFSNVVIQDDLLGFINICIPNLSNDASAGHYISVARSSTIKSCTKAARFILKHIATPTTDSYSNDFFCYSSFTANPATKPVDHKFILALNNNEPASTSEQTARFYRVSIYGVEKTELATPIDFNSNPSAANFRNDFNIPFDHFDSGSSTPIFNYKGILQMIKIIAPNKAVQTAGITGVIKTFDNCDLFYQYTATGAAVGLAFNQIGNTIYNKQNLPSNDAQRFEICLRCAFGYSLTYAGAPTPAAAATNYPFPSCSDAKIAECTSSAVYGGLSTFLNSVFSCHQCATGMFPYIYIETKAFKGTTSGFSIEAPSNFVGWRIKGVYNNDATPNINNRNAFNCVTHAANTAVFNGDGTSTAFTNCAAFAFVTTIVDNVVFLSGANNPTIFDQNAAPVCVACKGNYYPVYLFSDDVATNTGANDASKLRNPGWSVIECKKSLNCEESTGIITQFNACAKCRTDQDSSNPPTYYAFRDVLLTECYVSLSQNCFILKSNAVKNGGDNRCLVCKAGFFLNADELCESLTIPNATPTATFSRPFLFNYIFDSAITEFKFKIVQDDGVLDTTAFKIHFPTDLNFKLAYFIRIHYLLSGLGTPYGSSECNAGWVLAPPAFLAGSLCVKSSYLTANKFQSNTKFVSNCANYRGEILSDSLGTNTWKSYPFFQPPTWAPLTTPANEKRGLYCQFCKSGYNLKFEQNQCVLEGTILNCLYLATGNTKCQTCKVGFLNRDGVCVSDVIKDCTEHENTRELNGALTVLKCKVCANGFYLPTAATSCLAGQINNCNVYETNLPLICKKCKAGFTVLTVSITPATTYCYPIPATYNCEIWQGTSVSSGINYSTFSCSKCNQNTGGIYGVRSYNYLPSLVVTTKCLAFTPILNCLKYNQNNIVISQNDFLCAECAAGFWLQSSTKTCVARVNVSPNCSEFTPNADTCKTCKFGWYLSVDSTNCIAYPDGIYGCRTYSSRTVCTVCNSEFYLFQNKCIPSTQVLNCDVYSANYTCSSCKDGFFLQSEILCVVPTATNCREVLSMTACKNCPANNGLKTTNAITNCVSNAVSNCAISTFVDPFVCTTCNVGFFVNANGGCTAVTAAINGCLVYDSATTCLTCVNTGILNAERTSCDSTKYSGFMDVNCLSSKLLSAPVCSQCPLGSYFTDKACTLCPTNAISFGCLSCDPATPDLCLFCNSGYFMNKDGVCIRNNNLPENPNPVVPSPGSASLAKAVAFTVGLAALYSDEL